MVFFEQLHQKWSPSTSLSLIKIKSEDHHKRRAHKVSRLGGIYVQPCLALLAVLLLSANTWAAIEINNHQARNMDDVQSLGVIYINHNFATESEARQALNEETDAQGATYYHVILMREPGSNGNMHASADIYR